MTDFWIDIPRAREILKNPLYANRYIGLFTSSSPTNRTLINIFNSGTTNIGYLMNTFNAPSFAYNSKEQYIGGVMVPVTNMFEQGQVDMTLYNTGAEYETIYKWGELHYNQRTRCYGYMDDIYAELTVYEFDRGANVVLEHKFSKCSIYQYGGLQLSFEEATQIETFQLSLKFKQYTLKKH